MRVANEFTKHVERTVDALRGAVSDESYQEVRAILANIRKQYDDVHCEADRKDAELGDIRRKIRLLEAENSEPSGIVESHYGKVTHEQLQEKLQKVNEDTKLALETNRVYEHMVARLRREFMIVQEKVSVMDRHLNRKTHEVQKVQDRSRRVHQEKVRCINKLESMEQEIAHERELCAAALSDLDTSLRQRRSEVRHREDFERWRYEIALEAANEAFQATAGRYRKIYAVEKLTGNCLQKITFEQAETSQATEDGFQRIREVTGLTDVMDIVHKFLNRDTEHEQLRSAVREAEVKLHSLREAEASRLSEVTATATAAGGVDDGDVGAPDTSSAPRALAAEVAELDTELSEALRDHEEYMKRYQNGQVLLDRIVQWARSTSRSFAPFEELAPVESAQDLCAFMEALVKTVERFLHHARGAMPAAKLSKLASQATGKEYAEMSKLLTDKEFIRINCRVPASLDSARGLDDKLRGKREGGNMGGNEDERQDQEFASERERLRLESSQRISERMPKKRPPGAPSRREQGHRGSSKDAPAYEDVEGRPATARGGTTLMLPIVEEAQTARPASRGKTGSRPQSSRPYSARTPPPRPASVAC